MHIRIKKCIKHLLYVTLFASQLSDTFGEAGAGEVLCLGLEILNAAWSCTKGCSKS
jgi:hypothetical protein